ncbi:hypothetical protein B0H10DRAFT_1757760, partial [Mycena sp. CBHHK59/15]
LNGGIAQITKQEKILMQYMFHMEDIVVRYGVVLTGWTTDKFCNPSELSSSIQVLTTLCNMIKNGDCKWVKLMREEHKEHKAQWKADVASGEALARTCNPQADIGQKRKLTDDDEEEDEEPPNNDDLTEEIDGFTPGTTTSSTTTNSASSTTPVTAPATSSSITPSAAAMEPA